MHSLPLVKIKERPVLGIHQAFALSFITEHSFCYNAV